MENTSDATPEAWRALSPWGVSFGILVLMWMFLSAKSAIPPYLRFPFEDWMGPFGNFVKAISEEVFGAAIGTIVIFWFFEKRTMHKIEAELRNPLTFVNKLDPNELRKALAVRLHGMRGIPINAATAILQLLDSRILERGNYLKNFKVKYRLGALRHDNYREITVICEYNTINETRRRYGTINF